MRKSKKMLTVLLLMSLLMTMIFSGCGQEPNVTTTQAATTQAATTQAATTQAATTAQELPFVKLTYYYPATPQKDQQLVQDAMNKILKAKLNCELELHPTDWAQWPQKKQLILSSGENCDMIFAASWNAPGYYSEVGKNYYLPVDDLLKKYGQDILKLSLDGYLEAAKVKGVSYGVAVNKDAVMNKGFWLRDDLAKQLNVKSEDLLKMKYLEDVEPLLKAAKEKFPEIIPIYVTGNNQGSNFDELVGCTKECDEIGLRNKTKYFHWDQRLAYDFTKQETIPLYDIPEYIDQLKVLNKWMKLGYINNDVTTTQTSTYDMMKNGKAFIIITAVSPKHHVQVESMTSTKMFETPITLTLGIKGGGDAFGAAMCLPIACSNPERVMMVINEAYINKDLMNTFVFGIENVHYTKVSDNVIKLTDKVQDFNPGTDWEFGNWYVGEKGIYTKENESPNLYSELKAFASTFPISPLLGFSFDSSSVLTELANHQNVLSQYNLILANGVLDPVETAKTMKEKDKKAGVDKIIAEYNKQIKAFLAEKK